MVGNPERRDQMFRDAERVLVDDVGGIFIAHRWAGDLMQSWVQGTVRDPDSQGITGWHWGNDQDISLIYIAE